MRPIIYACKTTRSKQVDSFSVYRILAGGTEGIGTGGERIARKGIGSSPMPGIKLFPVDPIFFFVVTHVRI